MIDGFENQNGTPPGFRNEKNGSDKLCEIHNSFAYLNTREMAKSLQSRRGRPRQRGLWRSAFFAGRIVRSNTAYALSNTRQQEIKQ